DASYWNDDIIRNLAVHGPSFRWWTLVTSAFLHAGWMHLIGNMIFLWVFGQNVEDRFGRWWFLAFYLMGGVASGGLHAVFEKSPAIGASGAIAAVAGAFLVLFPRTHVRCLWFLGLIGIYMIPAWVFISISIARDLVLSGHSDGVARLAHLGGYGFGVSVCLVLLWRHVLPREPYDLFTIGKQAYRRRQFKELGARRDEVMNKKLARAARDAAPRSDEVAGARAQVAAHIGRSDLSAAAVSYKELVERHAHIPGATTLSRNHQYDLANYFFAESDHQTAAYCYERFLDGYASDSEAPRVRLLLGLINARYLNDPVRARAVLTDLAPVLRDAQQRALAETLLKELA
ncbi:MAG: rhomboid family intramembrane serine protease, partial [Pyrinomonadaceae bacterium]|nr:rhomboid family intramembrane serine protease [Phycisphaerales bacterium]